MATYKRFEELPIWQKARELCKTIYVIANNDSFNKDYRFRSQITSAAGSIMDNIAEGFEREGIKEFIQFIYIAKGSCGEVKSQLYRAFDVGYLQENVFTETKTKTEELCSSIYNLIGYLKSTDII